MSSFEHPHHFYLFETRDGHRKLAYGRSPEDALDVLRIRLGKEEMERILPERVRKLTQRELLDHVGELG